MKQEDKTTHGIPWWSLLPTALIAALAAWIIRPVLNPSEQTVEIEFPQGGSISIKSSAPISPDSVFAQIFSTTSGRQGALGVLRERFHIFHLEDERLAESLQSNLCEPIPETPLSDRLAKSRECADKPLATRLRALARAHLTPFHYEGEEVRVGVQHDNRYRPGKGKANVCRNGRFVAQRLQVIEPVLDRVVTVEASGVYDCTLPMYPVVQLDPDDAEILFARPTEKYELAIVMVIS